MISLSSKAAFITGGTSGIGLATAKVFVAHGGRVAVTGRDTTRLDAARKAIGSQCLAFLADSADDGAMSDALSATARAFGGLDIVFANAGRYVHAPLGDTPRQAIENQLGVVADIYMTVQLALAHLRDGASIIVMGSVYATMGQPGAGAYAASKAAAAAMARSMASELSARRIRVNVVVPGAIDTPGWPMSQLPPAQRDEHKRLLGERAPLNRMLRAEEVANAVLFLASDASSGIQASEIVVDGGTTGALAGSPRYLRGEP